MLEIKLERQSVLPLRKQIYQDIKNEITCGALQAESVLPSTRELSAELNVSRNTVVEAYEMLIAEGYIINHSGAVARVAAGVFIERNETAVKPEIVKKHPALIADFHTGRPDLREFPRYLWSQLLNKAAGEIPVESYGYSGPKGCPELCSEISAWLFRSRGITVSEDDIFITAGATHALHLLADLLCGDDGSVLMEDPCHSGMLRTFINKGCRIIPISTDSHGMQTQYLPGSTDAGMVYVTPSHQFPLGGILPASRRTELVNYAIKNNLYIIEDDYDSEFRYSGEPVTPMYSMDTQRVIYVGTFSKSLFPALRIGFVILPEKLQKKWRELRTCTDVQNPPFEQAALAGFLKTRKFDRHVQKMRRIYGQRRKALLEALYKYFGEDWSVSGDVAGLHVAVDFPGRCFDEEFRQNCLDNGIYITPLETHCIKKGEHTSKLLMGYGHMNPDEIKKSVSILAEFIK